MGLSPIEADRLTIYEWFCFFYGWQKKQIDKQRWDMQTALMFVNTQLQKPLSIDDVFAPAKPAAGNKETQRENKRHVDEVFASPELGNTQLDKFMESLGVN